MHVVQPELILSDGRESAESAGGSESGRDRVDGPHLRGVLFYAAIVLSISACIAFVLPFVRLLSWAVVLMVIALPAHRRIGARIRNESLVAALSCLFLTLCVLLPVTVLSVRLASEVRMIASELKSRPQPQPDAATGPATETAGIDGIHRWLKRQAAILRVDLDATLKQASSQLSGYLARQTLAVAKIVAWDIVQMALIFLTLFFLLRDGNRIRDQVRPFLPLEEDEAGRLFGRVADTIHATVYGNIVVALAQGSLAGLAYWALGIPAPLMWTVATMALCLIPLLGAPVVWIPAAALLAYNGEVGRAAIMAGWGMLVVGTIDNVLRPIVVGSRTQLHPLPLFFCIFGAVLALGAVGIVLGPVVLAVTVSLLDILRSRLAPGGEMGGDTASPAIRAE